MAREKIYSFAYVNWKYDTADRPKIFRDLEDLIQFVDTQEQENNLLNAKLYCHVGDLIKYCNNYQEVLEYFENLNT